MNKSSDTDSLFFYGLGHCLVDFFVTEVEDEEFEKIYKKSPLHLENQDFSELFKSFSPRIKKAGGTTVNVLKTLSKLGGKCFFSGSTGTFASKRDDNALFFQREMARHGIESQLFSQEGRTGCFLSVYNKKGEKAIAVHVGAAKKIEVSQLNEIRFAHCDCFVMEGMQFLNDVLFEQIMDYSFRYNVPIAIDCGSTFGAKAVGKKLADVGQSLDIILFANENEAKVLKEIENNPEKYCKIYIETLGDKGSIAFFEGNKFDQRAYLQEDTRNNSILGFLEDTGAGDAFAGAFLYTLFSHSKNILLDLSFEVIERAMNFASKEAFFAMSDFGL